MSSYFQLYGIKPTFHPDKAEIKKKFYELSRSYHPDRFTNAENHKQAEALKMAATNNEAYKTLIDENKLIAYILKSHGVIEDEEKYVLPPSFLMEMMELNEALSDYEMEPDNDELLTQAKTLLGEQLQEWQDKVTPLTLKYDEHGPSDSLMQQIKDYYYRKKYLLRIQERMNTFASR